MSELNGYIDESGSYGFNFENHNTHFVVTVILVEKGEKTLALEQELKNIQAEVFNGAEIKSNKIKDRTRQRIFTRIKNFEFNYYSIVVDKREIYDDSGVRNWKESFYKYLNRQLYNKLFNTFSRITVFADEMIDNKFIVSFKKYLITETQNTLFQQVRFADSEAHTIIQLADIVSGTINRFISRKSRVNVFVELASQNSGYFNWPEKRIRYFEKHSDNGEFSGEIRKLSLLRADNYLVKNKNSQDPEIVLKVKFLEFLKEILLYKGPSAYVHRSEIIENISKGIDKPINDNYFNSKILAPLRDNDVLIASNKRGYKLPTSKNDLIDFIEMFFANIDPMIKRIKSCNDSIVLATGGKLNLLEDDKYDYLRSIITHSNKD